MQYRSLGRSGITVSTVCLGTMTFGTQTKEDEAHRQLDLARAAGVTLIDTAEAYPVPPSPETQGDTERVIGTWLKARGGRDKVVLATKVVGQAARATHIRGGKSRPDLKNIREAVDASLKRMQTDYIDLYQLHFPDRATNNFEKLGYAHDPADANWVPLAETMAAMGTLIREGKIRAFGLSNESAWGLMTHFWLNERDPSLPRPAAIQNPYSLVNRAFDVGLAEISIREDCPLLAWSPLSFGGLTGKYLNGKPQEGTRLAINNPGWARYLWPRAQAAYRAYVELARKHGLSPTGMALAYVASRPFTGSTIVGARTTAQLREDLELIEGTTLNADVIAGIETIHGDNPNPVVK